MNDDREPQPQPDPSIDSDAVPDRPGGQGPAADPPQNPVVEPAPAERQE